MCKLAILTESQLTNLVQSYEIRPLRLRGGYGNSASTIPSYWQTMWTNGLLMVCLIGVPARYCDCRSRP